LRVRVSPPELSSSFGPERTIKTWFDKIANYHLAKVSNGPTEALNNLIKRIKRIGFGFRNFENNRICDPLYAGKPNWRVLGSIVDRRAGRPDQNPKIRYFGAEDGIRTRDPHLGKVVVFVLLGLAAPLKCGSVHAVSSPSIQFSAVVDRSTIDRAGAIGLQTLRPHLSTGSPTMTGKFAR
jgi:Transposase